ncbi:carboxypeptidase-like regulatory domain-containing protein [Flavobacterium gilvum]|uniref:Uncharacterized protein n=1 Tax=Flavobacterium gilvum TaxID=1492737 RepID=A0AAC9N558_9FLAO|nr:carboxypeptidase-like regulatory domain-containing protein [Flavobacterium gilvum]AOW09251.1 hypothetical protein EM308_06880 [Flavobacterium gilvum]KFC60124.1 hypothetical protein FEM08_11250 [Flavobacterium gilvum]
MKNSLLVLFVLLGQSQLMTAQTNVEKIITGTVLSDIAQLEGISVVNCSNKMIAVTDKNGCFSIQAKSGDILDFSGIDYKYLRKYVYKFEYNSGVMEVNMTAKAVELDEVVINKYGSINAESLGIIPKGQIKLTPQERRLYSSKGIVDGTYSILSGERSLLKMNLEVEKKELLLKKLEYLFGNKYYTNTLKIPEELIKGFQYYCVEDNEFVESLGLKNKTTTMFLMTNLATTYNQKRLGEE